MRLCEVPPHIHMWERCAPEREQSDLIVGCCIAAESVSNRVWEGIYLLCGLGSREMPTTLERWFEFGCS